MQPELTDAQRALVEGDSNAFIPACPGAGKTRAVVHRYLRLTDSPSRKGVGLLSFTNVAIDEVRARCGNRLDALQAPNFIGTFDAFINRYLTGPLYVRRYRRTPEFIETWETLPSANVPNSHVQFPANLDWFDFDTSGKATLVIERARHDLPARRAAQQGYLRQNAGWLARQAEERHASLISKGVLACSASRWFTRTELAQPEVRVLMSKLVGRRFTEIIIDEAQDCGEDELHLLEFLRGAGVDLTLVGDTDQAIYEFRRAIPSGLAAFVATLTPGARLNGNWRSSPAICALNGSLRVARETDKALGQHASVDTPVQVIQYRDLKELRARIGAVAAGVGVPESGLVVLAHSGNDARRAAGGQIAAEVGANKVIQIAVAARDLLTRQHEPRLRRRAIERVERLLLGRINALNQDDTVDALCEKVGVDRRWLRDSARRVITAANPDAMDRRAYTNAVQAAVGALTYPDGLALTRVTAYLITPTEAQWAKLGDTQTPQPDSLPWATVHSVKGQEFDAVALVIPRNLRKDPDGLTALDHWHNGTDAEARRVLYVGASRARRALILCVHTSHAGYVCKILERDQVPFEMHPV